MYVMLIAFISVRLSSQFLELRFPVALSVIFAVKFWIWFRVCLIDFE